MKFLLLLPLVLIAFYFIRCTTNKPIEYLFENKQNRLEEIVVLPANDSSTLMFNSFDFKIGKKTIELNYAFHEKPIGGEKLQSIAAVIYSKDEKGEFQELKSTSKIEYEFFDGKYSVKKSIASTELINKVINWKEVKYEYEFLNVKYIKEDNKILFNGTTTCVDYNYPETIKLILTLKWEDETKVVEKILTKHDYKGPKFNPKF